MLFHGDVHLTIIKYINIGKNYATYKNIYIQYMNLRDERHKLTQRLCTGYLDGHVVPQNWTSITKAFLTIF